LIHLEGVRKVYTSGDVDIEVLREVNLQVTRAESVAIRGVSGSGKSTLLNILGAIDKASEGLVEVCGQRLDLSNKAEFTQFRREKVGFIFQFYNLLPTLTALENVMVGPESAGMKSRLARAKALEYLEAVDLSDKAWKYPEQLSGGEQQRVAIARALAKEPPLILADEPTGSLDEETAARVMHLLDLLRAESHLTIIVVTHNPEVSLHTDRTVFLHSGHLSTDGSRNPSKIGIKS
jgi:putative ABC transport system ATP-binding protein